MAASGDDAREARDSLARLTQRGIGMTLAACVYWLAMATVAAWAGLDPEALGVFFLVGTVFVYPLGWALNRLFGGDLLARGHPLGGLVRVLGASQLLTWPLVTILFFRDLPVLAYALAALLGAHFLPYGWLYRAWAYYVLGIATVVVGAVLQWWWPQHATLAVPLCMAACYALATAAIARDNRRRR